MVKIDNFIRALLFQDVTEGNEAKPWYLKKRVLGSLILLVNSGLALWGTNEIDTATVLKFIDNLNALKINITELVKIIDTSTLPILTQIYGFFLLVLGITDKRRRDKIAKILEGKNENSKEVPLL